MRVVWGLLALVLLTTALPAQAVAQPPPPAPPPPLIPADSAVLRSAVTVEAIRAHMDALAKIAARNGGNRASGTKGFDESADYVAQQLERAGYAVSRQPFEFPFFEQTAPPVLRRTAPQAQDFAPGVDFMTMVFSPSGDVTAPVSAVDLTLPPGPAPNSTTSGCEPQDFDRFPRGHIALLQRGGCPLAQKARNAEAAGAGAVLIFNEGQPDRRGLLAGTLRDAALKIPVAGTSFAVGEQLAAGGTVRLAIRTNSGVRATVNLFAETPGGRANRTVVVGGHLDSVVEGPGVNDNGSGSAVILETALQLARLSFSPPNRIRFAFWGAEESGLLGSKHYVGGLSDAQLADIAANLNFDMLGSPNYVRFVYDGDGSDTPDPDTGSAGSGLIERVFNDYFAGRRLAVAPTPFDGRSDYGPFIERGIPAGGLFSGAEGLKTQAQATVYGGTAGTAYDGCYHQPCDGIDNLSRQALDELSDAAVHAILTLASTDLPPRPAPPTPPTP